jgi:hypothetical protein
LRALFRAGRAGNVAVLGGGTALALAAGAAGVMLRIIGLTTAGQAEDVP